MHHKIVIHNESEEIKSLIDKDPNLEPLFQKKREIVVHVSKNYYQSLIETIIAQQLSTKAALAISNRFNEFMQDDMKPEHILAVEDEKLRALGLSRQKIKYLKSLAEHVKSEKLTFDQFEQMTDEQIIEELTQVKGIGVWTAQMFLMFSMGRMDVFSTLDLGLRNALKKLLNRPDMTFEEIEAYSHKWKPYRSIVSHYLWHIWDEA
jgi:DNA-3-methyladenine glycosylase II